MWFTRAKNGCRIEISTLGVKYLSRAMRELEVYIVSVSDATFMRGCILLLKNDNLST